MTSKAEYSSETSNNWSGDPMINALFLRNVHNYLQDRLAARGHLFLNEVHEQLGLPPIMEGQMVGWRFFEGRTADLWTDVAEEDGVLTLAFDLDGIILGELKGGDFSV